MNNDDVKLVELFVLFQEYIGIMTNDHSYKCLCNYCLATLEICRDGSGELILDNAGILFSWDTLSEAVVELNSYLTVLRG